jgi:DNA-binding transcriptional regulator LsrR (DeoR family)
MGLYDWLMPEFEPRLDPFEVAEAYYSLPPGQRGCKPLVELFKLPGRNVKEVTSSQNRLSKMVRDLERRGLIHHCVLRKDTEFLPRKPELENDLRRRFALRQAVVVDISSLVFPKGTPTTHRDPWNRYDDLIHERLGAWAGRVLASCLRPGDNVATGGGRGPHFAVQRCSVGLATRYSGNILPLTGRISTHVWHHKGDTDTDVPSYLDADNVASLLHGTLGTKGKVCSPNCSITKNCILPSTDEVTVAIIGIGSLGGGHRLKHFDRLEDVESVRDLLREINKMADTIEHTAENNAPPFYHPVGDVCNWYFVVARAPEQSASKDWHRLETAVNELNRKFMNTTPESLAKISKRGMVLAVAGGPHKAAAIRHVLYKSRENMNREGSWITHLVTDHLAANWILQREKESSDHDHL